MENVFSAYKIEIETFYLENLIALNGIVNNYNIFPSITNNTIKIHCSILLFIYFVKLRSVYKTV